MIAVFLVALPTGISKLLPSTWGMQYRFLEALAWPTGGKLSQWWRSSVDHRALPALIRTADKPGTKGGAGPFYPTGWASAQSREGDMEHRTLPALAMGEPTRWNPGGRASAQNPETSMDQKPLPAVLETTLSDRWKLNPPNWMDERLKGTAAYYPHALISYYHWKDVKFRFPSDAYIFGDSGGYSVMTLRAVVDPRDVIRWQIKNCSVGCLLDVPPRDQDGKLIWADAISRTVANARRGLLIYEAARKQETPFRWWGVCQGGTLQQLNEWFGAVERVYPFAEAGEGWSFKPYPHINPVNTARVLGFIKTRKVTRAHFLMTTGYNTVATLLCLGPEAGLDLVTYDSSTASLAGINRCVYAAAPDSLSWSVIEEKTRASKGQDRRVRDYLMECQCLSCKFLRQDLKEHPKEITEEYWKYRFIFHNTLTMLRVFDALAMAAREDPHALLKQQLGSDEYYSALRAFEGREVVEGVAQGTPRSLLDLL